MGRDVRPVDNAVAEVESVRHVRRVVVDGPEEARGGVEPDRCRVGGSRPEAASVPRDADCVEGVASEAGRHGVEHPRADREGLRLDAPVPSSPSPIHGVGLRGLLAGGAAAGVRRRGSSRTRAKNAADEGPRSGNPGHAGSRKLGAV